jgi:hypothetical protein
VALDNTITMGCVPTVQHQDLTVLQLELTHVLNVAHARTHNSDQDVGAAVQVLVQAAEDVVEGRCLQAAREIAYLIITAVQSVAVELIQQVVTQEDALDVVLGHIVEILLPLALHVALAQTHSSDQDAEIVQVLV